MNVDHLPGVYEIINEITGDRYIGSTSRGVIARIKDHTCALRGGRGSKILQQSWNKYGSAAFVWRPLLVCPSGQVRAYEARAIEALRPELNATHQCLTPTAANIETRKRIAAMKKGTKATPETRERMSRAQKARGQRSAEVVARMAEVRRKRVKRYEVCGENLMIAEITALYGVPRDVFLARVNRLRWTATRAATTPPNPVGTNQYTK